MKKLQKLQYRFQDWLSEINTTVTYNWSTHSFTRTRNRFQKVLWRLEMDLRSGKYKWKNMMGWIFGTYGEGVQKHTFLYKIVHLCWLLGHKGQRKESPFCSRCAKRLRK